MADYYALTAVLSDGLRIDLEGLYPTKPQASRAAARYMVDYRDPCGIGVHVAAMTIIPVIDA